MPQATLPSKRHARQASVVLTEPAPSAGSYKRRAAAFFAMNWHTRGTVSIRQADAPSAIGIIEPEACMAQAPASSDAWPTA